MPKEKEKQSGDDDSTSRLESAMTALLEKQGGDSSKVILKLLEENYKLRSDKRDLKTQLEEVEVPEGAVVLSGDDVATWNSFKELGKKVEDITATFTKNEELQGELDKRDRSALHSDAAKVVGYNANVLTELVEARGLTVEMKDVEVQKDDGSKVTEKKPFVKAGEKADSVELTSYAESNFKDFLPALTSAGEQKDQISGRNVPPQHRSPPSSQSKKGETTEAAKKVMSQYKSPGQLRKESKE